MINTNFDQKMVLPEEDRRCTTVLMDILEGYEGISEAYFDINTTRLKVEYNPQVLSPERAMSLVRRAGRAAGARTRKCALKSDETCRQCAVSMANELVDHYRQIADLELAPVEYKNGVIDVHVDNQGSSGALAAIETTLGQPFKEIFQLPQISRRHLEIAFTTITLLATVVGFIGGRTGMAPEVRSLFFVIAYLFGGVYGVIDGIKAALEEHKLDVNFLMIFAALGAAVIGQPLEGAVLLFLFSLSNTLQTFALERNRRAIENLLDLRPPKARVRRGSRVEEVAVEKIMIGDTVLIKPGERIPVDAEVTDGSSEVDQATITGESVPVHKEPGDSIFASTVNGNGALEARVTRLAQDTTLARIVQMVEEAQQSRARTQTRINRFEQVYAWLVLGSAALLTIIPYFLLGHEFMPTFYRAMTLLVVASPCALVISIPASILSAIANGARNGVLFKGGIHLEKTAGVKVFAFDKTGTLTSGTPSLRSVFTYGDTSEETLVRLAAAAEARSEHPIGQAITLAADKRSIQVPKSNAFRALPGQGVESTVEGERILVGNPRLFETQGVEIPPDLRQQMRELEDDGQTAMLVCSGGRWLGGLGVADSIRSDAPEIIKRLKAIGVEHIVMLTGDNDRVAKAIAAQLNVDEVHANLLPEDKVGILEELRRKYGSIAMIGDGVNDAPALAKADVGIAMGGAGSDVALETADIVLMADDLTNLPHAVRLAHRAKRIVYQNLGFSLAVIVALVIATFGFELALPLGVVGHEGSTVLVVLNGLRLLGMSKQ